MVGRWIEETGIWNVLEREFFQSPVILVHRSGLSTRISEMAQGKREWAQSYSGTIKYRSSIEKLGIALTQPDAICWGHANPNLPTPWWSRLPTDPSRVRCVFSRRPGVPGLPTEAPLAAGIRLS